MTQLKRRKIRNGYLHFTCNVVTLESLQTRYQSKYFKVFELLLGSKYRLINIKVILSGQSASLKVFVVCRLFCCLLHLNKVKATPNKV